MLLKKLFFIILGLTISWTPISAGADDSFDFMDDEFDTDYAEETYDTDDFSVEENSDIAFADSDDSATDSEPVDVSSSTLNPGSGLVNVEDFDIAGFMLGMSFDDVYNLYNNWGNLYRPIKKGSLVYDIPADWKNNLDYECRQAGVIQPNKLKKCINGLARSRGLLYISVVHLERAKTGEKINLFFTSNATDNLVYKIEYKNDADDVPGRNQKFADQRDKKMLAFWKTVVKKYGMPNSGNDQWIMSTNAYDPKMTAYAGALVLVDENRHVEDENKSVQQSRDNFRAKPYAF